MNEQVQLSRRERQIMDIIYACDEASVNDVFEKLSDPPARVSVRTLLRILEEKGHLKHYQKGKEFIYRPTQPREQAAGSALERVLSTFFGGSIEQAVAAHLSRHKAKISDAEFQRLKALIRQTQKEEK